VGFELHLGLGTPLGFIGVALDYAVTPMLSVNAGVGLGGSGPQGAVSARLRIPSFSAHSAPYIGLGLSGGPYTPWSLCIPAGEGDCSPPAYHWDTAYWVNFEAGGEMRTPSNVTIRAYAGLGWMLNPGDGQTGEPPGVAGPAGDQWLFYLGGAIGYAVGP
jgi:hypothetical protein